MQLTFFSVLRFITILSAFSMVGLAQTLAPAALSFANASIGVKSSAQTATLTNTLTVTLTISSINSGGANASDFPVDLPDTNCGSTPLAPGASCTIAVAFDPTASGIRSGTLTVIDDAPGTPPQISLSGTGIAAATDTLSANALNFGANNSIGVPTAAQMVTVSNSGTDSLTISGITTGGTNAADFNASNTCGGSVLPNSSCTISVIFTATLAGPESAAITLTDDAADSPQVITLTGSGVGSGSVPLVGLAPTSVSFGNANVGVTTAGQTVTLTNNGGATLTVAITIGGTNAGDFAETDNCAGSVAAAQTCAIVVTFDPTATGSRSASLIFTDNAGDSPESVALTGTGVVQVVAPVVFLAPTSLTFASTNVGIGTAPQTVTLTNNGNANLIIGNITIGGSNSSDFATTNNCGNSLAAAQACTISVTFAPTASGTRSASLILTDNAGDSPETVALSGIGVVVASASLSPTSLSFGNSNVGTASTSQSVTLSNTGSGALTVGSIAIASGNTTDFSTTNNCGTSVAAAGTCTISVTFNPTATGARSAVLAVTDNASGSPQQVTLSGTGVGVPTGSLSPAGVNFGTSSVGVIAASQTVILANSGTGRLYIASIGLAGGNPGDFGTTNTCGLFQEPGQSCAIAVTFTPTAAGFRSATLVVTDNANNNTGSQQAITLIGTGIAPIASVTPASIGFGTGTPAQTVTVANTGTDTLTFSSPPALGGTNPSSFTLVNSCGPTLTAGSSCVLLVSFTSSSQSSATLTITDNSNGVSGSTQTVNLSALSPLSLSGATLAGGTVGSPYSAKIAPQGGTSPYTWSVADGSAIPQGTTLNAATGEISGTPTLAGTSTFTIKVTDSSSPQQSASASFSISVITSTPIIPSFSITNLPGTAPPGTNITAGTINWNPLSSITYSGTLTLALSPASTITGLPAGYLGDAGFVGSDGTKSASTTIGLPTATASSVALPTFDPGTVAGNLALTLTIDGQPAAAATSSVTIQPAAPIIEAGSVQINSVTSTGFNVELVATSTTRDLETATFTFTAAAGAQLNGTSFSVNVSSLLTPWFASASGLSYGGAFSLTIPFTLSGSSSAIGSVSVTLTNSVGTSAAASGVL